MGECRPHDSLDARVEMDPGLRRGDSVIETVTRLPLRYRIHNGQRGHVHNTSYRR